MQTGFAAREGLEVTQQSQVGSQDSLGSKQLKMQKQLAWTQQSGAEVTDEGICLCLAVTPSARSELAPAGTPYATPHGAPTKPGTTSGTRNGAGISINELICSAREG